MRSWLERAWNFFFCFGEQGLFYFSEHYGYGKIGFLSFKKGWWWSDKRETKEDFTFYKCRDLALLVIFLTGILLVKRMKDPCLILTLQMHTLHWAEQSSEGTDPVRPQRPAKDRIVLQDRSEVTGGLWTQEWGTYFKKKSLQHLWEKKKRRRMYR